MARDEKEAVSSLQGSTYKELQLTHVARDEKETVSSLPGSTYKELQLTHMARDAILVSLQGKQHHSTLLLLK